MTVRSAGDARRRSPPPAWRRTAPRSWCSAPLCSLFPLRCLRHSSYCRHRIKATALFRMRSICLRTRVFSFNAARGIWGKVLKDSLGIPVGWRILELGVRDDYFDIWKRIREHAPVHDAGEGVFLVSEWDLVNSALRNPILRAGSGVSAAFGQDSPVESVVRNWLMSLNGDEHRQARGLVSRVFAPRSLVELEPVIRETARRLIRPFVEKATGAPSDFV